MDRKQKGMKRETLCGCSSSSVRCDAFFAQVVPLTLGLYHIVSLTMKRERERDPEAEELEELEPQPCKFTRDQMSQEEPKDLVNALVNIVEARHPFSELSN